MGSVNANATPEPLLQFVERNMRSKVPVYDTSGTTQVNGNSTLNMDFPMRELFISNDSAANLTIAVTGNAGLNMGFLLLPGETLNERLPLFTKVVVTATGNWRWYVRGGRII